MALTPQCIRGAGARRWDKSRAGRDYARTSLPADRPIHIKRQPSRPAASHPQYSSPSPCPPGQVSGRGIRLWSKPPCPPWSQHRSITAMASGTGTTPAAILTAGARHGSGLRSRRAAGKSRAGRGLAINLPARRGPDTEINLKASQRSGQPQSRRELCASAAIRSTSSRGSTPDDGRRHGPDCRCSVSRHGRAEQQPLFCRGYDRRIMGPVRAWVYPARRR